MSLLDALAVGEGVNTRASKVIGDYRLGTVLGHGAFSKVYRATNVTTGVEYALKRIDKKLIKEQGLEESLVHEIEIMNSLDHPNLIKLYHVMQSANHWWLVLELATDGELFGRINQETGGLKESDARAYFQQIVAGVAFLHGRQPPIYHRDLKCENILLSENARTVKIADFGLSKISRRGELLRTRCGTPAYSAPELVLGDGTGYEGGPADVWSLGVVLYAMLTQSYPIEAQSYPELIQRLRVAKIQYPSTLGADVKDLLQRIFVPDPANRLTVAQVKAHRWVRVGYSETPGSVRPVAPLQFPMCEIREEEKENAFELIARLTGGALSRIAEERASSAVYCPSRLAPSAALEAVAAAVREARGEVEIDGERGLRCTWQRQEGMQHLEFAVKLRPATGSDTLFVELSRIRGSQLDLLRMRDTLMRLRRL